jgi:endonuclease/exonuclease/phosphatase family metal-dependent hydrolase
MKNKINLLLIISILFSFSMYAYSDNDETITIASFNTDKFGQQKVKNEKTLNIIASIISKYDIIAIQEIRDKSGTAIKKLEKAVNNLGDEYYSYIISERLGRTSSKEQYCYFYKSNKVRVVSSYTYNDHANDTFHREPFIAYFQIIDAKFDFVLINIHTDPDDATNEIKALPLVIENAKKNLKESDIIILGDFNADCNYYKENSYLLTFPADKYVWVITNDFDTTVKSSTDCTYDRIVCTSSVKEDYANNAGVYRFDTIYKLSQKKAKVISDHYPVFCSFYINKDTD